MSKSINNRSIPLNKLNWSQLPDPLDGMTPKQADDHRVQVLSLCKLLDDAEISERVAYGLTFGCMLLSMYLDIQPDSSILWFVLKFSLYGALISSSILSYVRRRTRIESERHYYRTILGKAYHE
ncbi:hypothetical protein N9F63_00650 [bacterium]|nr:hypothetical protein [bacterium]